MTTTINLKEIERRAFRATYQECAPAVIVYAGHECRKLDDWTLAIPL